MEFTFEDFKKRAKDPSLSKFEKIGFPDTYRKNLEGQIFMDIESKLDINQHGLKILDIGCGCSELVDQLILHTKKNSGSLFLVDSKEMLANIDKELLDETIKLIPGYFPKIDSFNSEGEIFFDRILIYSVLQYVFLEQSVYEFIHKCVNLIHPGGRILIGDIPNYSKRSRFLESREGKEFIERGILYNDPINIKHEKEERIDDSIVISIISRFRNFGCETYLLPQPLELPFGNRREDILIVKR